MQERFEIMVGSPIFEAKNLINELLNVGIQF